MSDYLTPDQAAARLGVTGETVRRWIRTGRLPAVRVGLSRYRIRVEDVDRAPHPTRFGERARNVGAAAIREDEIAVIVGMDEDGTLQIARAEVAPSQAPDAGVTREEVPHGNAT